ncbi:MAG: zinc-dependent metalloprotease family protein, partial [Planctomycetota bacterium]
PLPPKGGERGGSREACGGGFPCLAELACDADYPYFLHYGSVSAVENRINTVINLVNIQYEEEVEIIHEITAVIVRTSSAADPYSTSVAEDLLGQFRSHWQNNHGNIQRDLAQLFTGRNLNGGTIGIAWLDAVCSSFAYSVVESDCCGSLGCATDLSAHEMGHNWGSGHCSCPGWTMHPSIQCANRFTSGSISQIVSYRNSIQFCLEAGGDMAPDPMTFFIPPSGASTSAVIMVATTVQGGAPPPVEYFFDFVSGGSGGNDSSWQPETQTGYTDSGLETNTPYTYRVKARDSGSPPNETAYSASLQTATRIETPTGLVIGTVTTDSVGLSAAGTFTNLNAGSSGIYFDSTTSGGDGGINEWLQITTDTATGLSPDTMYDFRTKARNQLGVETAYTDPVVSKATLANVPGAPVLTALDCMSMDVDVAPDGNSALTTYAMLCTDTSPHDATWDGKYVDAAGSPSGSAVYQTAAEWDTTVALGLDEQKSYTFEASARNQEGVETAAGPTATQATPECSVLGDGDFDFDGDRDVFDFAAFQECFGQLVGPGCEPGNMAGDDMIGLDDYQEFYNSMTGPL